MKQIVTTARIGETDTAPKVLLCTLFRLPVFNTFGCILEIGEMGSCNIMIAHSPKRGAGAVYARHASLADPEPHIGSPLLPRVANATFAKGRF